MVPVRALLAESLARELETLIETLHTSWLWPSPDTGFAAYVFRLAGQDIPFEVQPLTFSAAEIERFDEAPVLAAGGYAFSLGCIEPNGDLALAWKDGLTRLSTREPFPSDHNSFFFRPTELLGISLGASSCPIVEERQRQWLRSVIKDGEGLLRSAGVWERVLGYSALLTIAGAGAPVKLVRTEEMEVEELSLLNWLRIADGQVGRALQLDMLKSQLNEAMLAKALEEPPKPRGAARVALLIVALRRAIREVLRSASEENWQLGSETRDALALIRVLCSRFPVFANQLRLRRGTRRSLVIRDEYDVQNLLHSLLLLHFEDVRPEEWTPSYAGKASRTDFLLRREEIVIETKMTRDGLDQKKLGDELIIDKERYRVHPNCKSLVCFVYDPDHRCNNPTALEDDLSQEAPFRVAVIVAPK